MRVIKKYPNRRLYDTSSSSYVTLAQVRDLVMQHQPFVVRDAKTGEDLTRSILLQIILEQEAAGAPLFSEAMLAGIIRFYGHALQGFMGSYLEKNVQALMALQAQLAEPSKGFSPEMWAQFMRMHSPMMQGLMGNYLEQSQNAFLQMQEQMTRQAEQVWGAFGGKR
ncbi:MAG: polyhydroxyalkanoate synthesis repressor PhaR [Pseudomonadota bacterium]|nr:polyhydroxyalkanoate synthesis repressor PhaR [Pseudomonadota bacterium]